MSVIEIQRQILPLLDSPNQGARFYNPELPASLSFPATGLAPAADHPSNTG
jgi:hypothetical protein